MKTTIEVSGYEIVIDEVDGVLNISASKDGDVVEEFTLDLSEESVEGDVDADVDDNDEVESNIKGFDEFGKEEDDFEGEDEGEDDDEDEGEDDDEDEGDDEGEDDLPKLETFQSYFKRKNK